MRALRCRLVSCFVVALSCLLPSSPALAMCDVIPGVIQAYGGARGSLNRPFAIPNGDGEEILIRLRPVCEPDSTGFSELPGGLVPEDDYFVTVLFEPPGGGARNAVVIGTEATRPLCEALASQAGALPGGGKACCAGDPGCSLPAVAPPRIEGECIGGSRTGEACDLQAAECGEGGACLPFRLRFRFPDTDPFVGTPDNDRTLTGPATIAVTPVTDPLPVGLASARCADTPGLVACIDELYARDGTCETPVDHFDATFGRFTALPPANDYQALCITDGAAGGPCLPDPDREVRFTVDSAGHALIPMDYHGILVVTDRIPIPRIARGESSIDALLKSPGKPVHLPSDAFIASFNPGGHRLPPIFTPLQGEADEATALFGSVDAPLGVIRVHRSRCVGGPMDQEPCVANAECGVGGSCEALFDF